MTEEDKSFKARLDEDDKMIQGTVQRAVEDFLGREIGACAALGVSQEEVA